MLVTGFLMTVAVSGLSGCRTSPTVAAYVGDEQVTMSELDAALDARREDADIDAYAAANEQTFTQRVLTLLVEEQVYTAAEERYGVEVPADDVRARIEQLLAGQDPDQVYAQLASTQGASRADVFETVREQMVREQIAVEEGKAPELTEEGLRTAYEQSRQDPATVQLGYIAVRDQATADAVLAQLTADPSRYAAVAAQYAGQYTLPEIEQRSPDQIPGPLAQQATTAKPGTGFTVAVPEVGGVVVAFIGPYPSFEELRPQLEQQAASSASDAGAELVNVVRDDLGVRVNPRYQLEEKDGRLVPAEGGVVDLLGDENSGAGEAGTAPPGN